MNASERLQAIIQERKEWEAFGWGPALAAWAVVLVVKTAVEVWAGPGVVIGAVSYLVALGIQIGFALGPRASLGARQVPMHGLWALVALSGWFFGSWAPWNGMMPAVGASVVELIFLAGGLVLTGFLKGRRALVLAGVSLVVEAVFVAVFPVLWSWRPLLLAGTFGPAAVAALVSDRQPSSKG